MSILGRFTLNCFFLAPVFLYMQKWVCECESRSVASDSLQPFGLHSPWNSPGQNTGVGSPSLLQGIFPIQGSNPGLPHCRQILYQLSHQGSYHLVILHSIVFTVLINLNCLLPFYSQNCQLCHLKYFTFVKHIFCQPSKKKHSADTFLLMKELPNGWLQIIHCFSAVFTYFHLCLTTTSVVYQKKKNKKLKIRKILTIYGQPLYTDGITLRISELAIFSNFCPP